MWIEMSQYIPKTAIRRLPPISALGSDAQPGRPLTRSEYLASLPTHWIFPLRCAVMIQSRIPVAIIAPTVAPMTWPMAAPPAGGSLAAIVEVSVESMRPPQSGRSGWPGPCRRWPRLGHYALGSLTDRSFSYVPHSAHMGTCDVCHALSE